MKTYFSVLPLLLATTFSAVAQTAPAPEMTRYGNRWLITAYDDASPTHQQWATQGLCFYYVGTHGTHHRYYWVSDTFPDWNGRATQEGDQLFLHGDYDKDRGHDAMQVELTTSSKGDIAFGHWQEWREDGRYGTTIGYANARMERVGTCRGRTVGEALELSLKLEKSVNANGEVQATPFGFTEKNLFEIEENDNKTLSAQ